MGTYWVYLLKCSDNTLYAGFTTNLEKRLQRHSSGRGSKYTRARLPVSLAYAERAPTLRSALKREIEIKRLSRSEKLLLCSTFKPSEGNSVR